MRTRERAGRMPPESAAPRLRLMPMGVPARMVRDPNVESLLLITQAGRMPALPGDARGPRVYVPAGASGSPVQ